MEKENISEIDNLIDEGKTLLPPDQYGTGDDIKGYHFLQSSHHIVVSLLGTDSQQALLIKSVLESEYRSNWIKQISIKRVLGTLISIRDLHENDMLKNPKYLFLAENFNQFIDYAEEFHNDSKLKESGSLIGVILEDTIKNIAEKNGITRNQDNDQIISALVRNNTINKSMGKRIRSWYEVRHNALHADWENLKLEHIGEAIKGCRELIANYL